MRRRYTNTTPYETGARFNSTCGCGNTIKAGDTIMYFPAQRKAECSTCAVKTREALEDERMYAATYGGGY